MVSFDSRVAGTTAAKWRADPRMHDRPPLSLGGVDQLIVVAAHPDDESLGAGGLIAECVRRGIPSTIIIVTDGGDRQVRGAEARAAGAALGASVRQLHFTDGGTVDERREIREELSRALASASPHALIAAPWRGDGHRDHRVVGEIVAELTPDRRLLEYPIWMWHWGHPASEDVPWESMLALPISAEVKQRALAQYPSQTHGDEPMLRADFLEHFAGDVELFIARAGTLDSHYFDATYARHDDPWGFETRWYEQRKRALTLAILPEERYARALEIGCSIGVLTAELAPRCDDLLAVDVSQAAVDRARSRVGRAARVERADVLHDFPSGQFDLVLLSEVGYYFDRTALERVLRSARAALAPGGTLVACHWLHPVAAYPLSGDEVHAALAGLGLPRVAVHREDDFVLEAYSTDPRSVAARTGLA